MEYTHYLKPTRSLTDSEWNKFTKHAQGIFNLAQVAIGDWSGGDNGPEITDSEVSFNGYLNDSCEACTIYKNPDPFDSCKTNHRPYDSIVGAIYLAYEAIHGGNIVTSDGDMDGADWEDARAIIANLIANETA